MQANFKSAILDGEILIWNKRSCSFMPLKNVRPVLEAARNHCAAGTTIKKDVEREGADGDGGDGVRLLHTAVDTSLRVFAYIEVRSRMQYRAQSDRRQPAAKSSNCRQHTRSVGHTTHDSWHNYAELTQNRKTCAHPAEHPSRCALVPEITTPSAQPSRNP